MKKDDTREELEQVEEVVAQEADLTLAAEELTEEVAEAPAQEAAETAPEAVEEVTEEAAEEATEEVAEEPSFEELMKAVVAKEAFGEEQDPASDEDDLRATTVLNEDLVQQVLSSPAFEDMESIGDADDPMIYRNFSNGYGKDVKKLNAFTKMSKEDRAQTVLMFIASGLCLCIVGLMIYWLVRFF